MPRVAVVIPSYNHASFVAEAVQSVLRQTMSDLELVVVDDGSTDNSLDILGRFSDRRLRLVSQPNRGAHAAINRGIELTSAPYIAILNSDDVYHPRRLEKLLPFIEANSSVGLVSSYIQVIDSQGRPLGIKHGYKSLEPWPLTTPEHSFRAGNDLRATLLTENYLATTSNYLFSREWYYQVGGFRNLRYTHDWDFALRIARVARIVLVPEPLVKYRIHQGNTIRENRAEMIFEICWCLAVHLPLHLQDASWFAQESLPQRITQLLYSIYTFGCEQVLIVMLLQFVTQGPETALRLLDPNNPERAVYLGWIQRNIKQGSHNGKRHFENVMSDLLKRLKGLLCVR